MTNAERNAVDFEGSRWPDGLAALLWLTIRRSLRTLLRGEAIGALIWPVLAASLIWLVVGALAWEPVTALVGGWLEAAGSPDAAGADAPWWAGALVIGVKFAFWLGVIPLIYVTALVLLAVWTLPGLIRRIAQRDYPILEFRRGGSTMGSVINTLVAVVLYLLGMLATLLLWWVPGALVLFPFVLTAWLNQRTFVYDCLSEVADRAELRTVAQRYKGWLFAIGMVGALLLWIPFVNLLAPVLIGILFTHATLELLAWERGTGRTTPSLSGDAPKAQSNWELQR